jgi:hypothetical protein
MSAPFLGPQGLYMSSGRSLRLVLVVESLRNYLQARVERGRVKVHYCRHKVVWDAVNSLIRRGYSVHTAIDKIYDVYGQEKNVTQIINQMLKDRRTTGGHPMLSL